MSKYTDKRSDFFKGYFKIAVPYDAYLATGKPQHGERWRDYEKKIFLGGAEEKRIKKFTRKMPVLIMSGIWCGDCARQGPMLRLIEKANPVFEMRYIDNREHPELQEELRINGAEKVPVIVSFSEDFYEIARFGDRHLSVYMRKLEKELGVACDPGFGAPGEELAYELKEWVDYFERLQALLRLSPMLRERYGD